MRRLLIFVILFAPASHAQIIGYGTTSPASGITSSISCSGITGVSSTANCYQVAVTCPTMGAVTAYLAVSLPSGSSLGTVVLNNPQAGAMQDNGFANSSALGPTYPAAGWTLIQTDWTTSWTAGGHGFNIFSCLPATLYLYIWRTFNNSSRTIPFILQGGSDGAAQFMDPITKTGIADFVDDVEPEAGPTSSNILCGCYPLSAYVTCPDSSAWNPSTSTPGYADIFVTSAYTGPYSYNKTSGVTTIADGWEGSVAGNSTACEDANPAAGLGSVVVPSQAVQTQWDADAILPLMSANQAGVLTNFPNTTATWWVCANASSVNVSAGQTGWTNQAGDLNFSNAPSTTLYTSGCSNEAAWEFATGFLAVQAIVAADGIPHHLTQPLPGAGFGVR